MIGLLPAALPRRALMLFAAALLAGCSVAPTRAPLDVEARQAYLAGLQRWNLRGRIGFRSADGEGGQANLRWSQLNDRSELRVTGPFGAGGYELVVEPDAVLVRDVKGERSIQYTGAAATEEFLLSQLGWAFPADAVRYWLLGLPDPAAEASTTLADDGLPEMLQQYGWAIRYERYANFDGVALPVKLQMENPRARLRVVVTDWELQP